MTAHQDAAVMVERLRTRSRVLNGPDIGPAEYRQNDAALDNEAATLIESLSKALSEAETERDRADTGMRICTNRVIAAESRLAEAMEVLEFYASPFEYVQNHRLDEQTPDFYDELNTGERAQNFLDAAAIRGGAK